MQRIEKKKSQYIEKKSNLDKAISNWINHSAEAIFYNNSI